MGRQTAKPSKPRRAVSNGNGSTANGYLGHAGAILVGAAAAAAAFKMYGNDDRHALGGWPAVKGTHRFSDGHEVVLDRISDAPMIAMIRSLLTPTEVNELQQLFRSHFHLSRDLSKPGETNATRMWIPTDAATDAPIASAAMDALNERIVELCNSVSIGEPAYRLTQLEYGYFSSYNKPANTPIWGLHNDNHARGMAENPRVLSLVIHLNEPPTGAMTVFPLARRIGVPPSMPDPTDELVRYIHHERPPPRNAAKGSLPEPWWRFIVRQIDHELHRRLAPAQRTPAAVMANRIYERAEEICTSDVWRALRPRAGDAAFFRSGNHVDGPEHRALHASCGNTGPKLVLAKFVRRDDLTGEQYRGL